MADTSTIALTSSEVEMLLTGLDDHMYYLDTYGRQDYSEESQRQQLREHQALYDRLSDPATWNNKEEE